MGMIVDKSNYYSNLTVSEILREEFMEPFGISAYRLAKDINVPVSRIQAILNGNRKITIDTSIRLGRYFGVSYEYFLNIQNAIDIREATANMAEDIKSISPFINKTLEPAQKLKYDSWNNGCEVMKVESEEYGDGDNIFWIKSLGNKLFSRLWTIHALDV